MAVLPDVDFFAEIALGNDGNDGKDNVGFGLVTADYTNATKTITETGAFAGYTWAAGDQIYLSAGAGITPGLYEVASKTDNDNIILSTSAGADSTADVVSSDGPFVSTQKLCDSCTAALPLGVVKASTEVISAKIDDDTNNGSAAVHIQIVAVNSSWEEDNTIHVIDADGSVNYCVQSTVYSKEWRNFSFINATSHGYYKSAGGIYLFYNCRFADNAGTGFYCTTGIVNHLAQCEFSSNDYGVYLSSHQHFWRCSFTANANDGFRTTSSVNIFYKCIFDDNDVNNGLVGGELCHWWGCTSLGDTRAMYDLGGAEMCSVVDCIIRDATDFINGGSASTMWVILNNLTYNLTNDMPQTVTYLDLNGVTELTVDPHVNAAASNFNLKQAAAYREESVLIGEYSETEDISYHSKGAVQRQNNRPLGR